MKGIDEGADEGERTKAKGKEDLGVNAYLPHEKLHVYADALTFLRATTPLVDAWPRRHAVCDQMQRAGESILANLAKGARRRRTDQGVYFVECSLGSVLECAACLDIAFVKGLVGDSVLRSGKESLQRIARMEVGLRRSWSDSVREAEEPYEAGTGEYFPHESLVVYQRSLQLCRQLEAGVLAGERRVRHARRIDETATSLVLNIAEGNGRFSRLDHGKFVQVAGDAAAMLGVYLDLAVAECSEGIEPAKVLLREIAALLAGLKGYLADDEKGGTG